MTKEYAPATVVSTAANYIMDREERFTHTYRTYFKLRENGPLQLRFWHSNAVDSTWDTGTVAKGSQLGGAWRIEAAYVADGGKEPDGAVAPGSQVPVTFDGENGKAVEPGETFWSDPVHIELPEGHYLAFTWTITAPAAGKTFPYNVEQMLVSAYDAPGRHADEESAEPFALSEKLLVAPAFIGYAKAVERQLTFFGDSITQGVRTALDGYEYWVARIAEGLGARYGVWNLGSGWARAYDAAADGAWLGKVKHGQGEHPGSQVILALGVNDIDIGARTAEQLLGDLETIISLLKKNDPATEIILFTVPPFNFSGSREQVWRSVNAAIRAASIPGVDRVFDMAALLSQAAPQEHRLRPEFMSPGDDPHPNGFAGKVVAEAFLKWYVG
ncbi:SGNH/GDSL hydrolase family protein [Paenibacillus macerans]|uniref:GDSL-like Lipase/Acylhydrolase family protein n=1 Tax=Paenibacillus macerans TaxID=44252 RepID=A0A090Z6P3_PAEMA|nr:SGNH/GDSL hydrolase family protein [Paenibacillus macerans]KFN05865.1 GDSL-like Lipase/Acylhydrolase family protein [Paenibacillus macerans]MCY7559533.1 SGNH/GDSL hydrolase family protein [Paenibacillus macerans]MEC0154481.1 SGNH/GDSL hydrolase family protein [Paenibacillus macerans]SUA85234.1 G-D-S-L family lipolytic protein [Paenibacillus macerans]